jgi:hypothetical protein
MLPPVEVQSWSSFPSAACTAATRGDTLMATYMAKVHTGTHSH